MQFTLTEGMRAMFSQYFRSAFIKKRMCNVFTDVIAHMFALNLSQVEQEIATKYFEPTMYTKYYVTFSLEVVWSPP